METLHFANNLSSMRKERSITQEELAAFVGVTKAAVSKWENGQSLPDILMLPQLATFFDVSVDMLLGYEPYLSKEQIRATYQRLATDFANKPFEEVMAESERLVRKYYSCYPFLTQICVLWTNHFMMAQGEDGPREILEQIENLCSHILKNCHDLQLANQTMGILAFAKLQQQKIQEVIEMLEEVCDANIFDQNRQLLIQAYIMKGDRERADKALQVELYRHVMQSIEKHLMLLMVHENEKERCAEIMRRTDALIELFEVYELNPNRVAGYEFQVAVVLLGFGDESGALERLEGYAQAVENLFHNHITLTGDAYFDRLKEWLDEQELGGGLVRDAKLVEESAKSVFVHPAIQAIADKKRLKAIEKKVELACRNWQAE